MSFPSRLLSSVVVASAVFSAAIVPLAVYGSKSAAIQIEDRPVFAGPLRELSAPYIGIATAMSISVGVASLSILSWQAIHRRLSSTEAKMATLQQQLQEKEAQVERLKFSEAKLQTLGLKKFLENESAPSTHGITNIHRLSSLSRRSHFLGDTAPTHESL